MPDPINGDWEIVVEDSNVTAIHSHFIPSGKVLYFHSRYPGHGATFTGYTFDSVVLISLPSVTHCFDANQKYIILDFRDDGAGNLEVEPPDNPNIAQPGPYMLFILLDKSLSNTGTNRIPSVAEIVFLQL